MPIFHRYVTACTLQKYVEYCHTRAFSSNENLASLSLQDRPRSGITFAQNHNHNNPTIQQYNHNHPLDYLVSDCDRVRDG